MVDRAPQDEAASQRYVFRPTAQSFGSIPVRGQWDSRRNSLTALQCEGGDPNVRQLEPARRVAAAG
jgi:hypothetical protein